MELMETPELQVSFEPTILMVDDGRENLKLLEHALRRAGFEQLHPVQNPCEVRRLFLEQRPDLILLDLHMPQLDGFAVLAQLRPLIQERGWVPVIVLTADQTDEARRRALTLGATDFVTKPFERVELVQRVRNALETRALYVRLQEQNSFLEERVRERTQKLEAMQARLLQAEVDKRNFYREVIRAVTHDRLHLVDGSELPDMGRPVFELPLDNPANYGTIRRELRRIALERGMAAEAGDDLVLAVGEAITNAIKHGQDGHCEITLSPDQLVVRVTDRGPGIHAEDLPASVLRTGFSTKVSLGVGYTLMLQLVDRLWLATGGGGTIVQLEKSLRAPAAEPEYPLLAGWDTAATLADDEWELA